MMNDLIYWFNTLPIWEQGIWLLLGVFGITITMAAIATIIDLLRHKRED